MKSFIVLLLISSLCISSCANKFLEEQPRGEVTSEFYYRNDSEALAAVYGIYGMVFFYNGLLRQDMYLRPEASSDLFTYKPGAAFNARSFPQYFVDSENPLLLEMWSSAYDAIGRCNAVIGNLSKDHPGISEDIKAKLIGEALFFRALMNYYLVQIWGNVPLVVEEKTDLGELNVEQADPADVWQQIIEDAVAAVAALPEKSEYDNIQRARASKGAARLLLAKSYMALGNWNAADEQIDQIIGSAEYGLEATIVDVFKVANENGLESILEGNYSEGFTPRKHNPSMSFWLPREGFLGNSTYSPNDYALAMYNPNSARYKYYFSGKGVMVSPYGEAITTIEKRVYLMKFYDFEHRGGFAPTNNDNPFNNKVFRYADVLLMKAEVENELRGPTPVAHNMLNQIRGRAGEEPVEGITDKGAFREIVFTERAMELIGENHRYFDLKRRGKEYFLDKVRQSRPDEIKDHQFLLPIPEADLRVNPLLEQNPGY